MLEFLADYLNHDGIIQKTETGDVIRDQVGRLGKIGQSGQDPLTIIIRQMPVLIFQHSNQYFELANTLKNKVLRIGLFDLFE